MATVMATEKLPLLKNGDSGSSVRFLEQLLSSIYWFSQRPNWPTLITENVIFDAKYDDQCQKIVKEFQQNYNANFPAPAPHITVDGIVGPETWQALGDAIFRYTYAFP
ncbi:peptidoglycan-binding domain-containing protein [Crocosphaera subtropica]|nr:peptidoglycan-binding domain-containing protein [Crocosphaera subtropica]